MKFYLSHQIKQNLYFYLPLWLFYFFAFYRLLFFSKIENHLFFNQIVGYPLLNWFFKFLTLFGDGWFIILIVLIWLFINIRKSLILFTSYAIAGGLVSILKNYIFDIARPHFVFDYFHKDIVVKYVDGVELLALNSFPSGHATAALALVTFLAHQIQNKYQKLILAIIGLLIVFSRVYLSQHWLNDIVAGSLLGWILTEIVIFLFYKFNLLNTLNRKIL